MHCPFCSFEDTQVKDSRSIEDGIAIKRRRFCPSCSQRFTTVERIQPREFLVIKRNGDRVLFERDKLLRSIQIAMRKRPVSSETIEKLVNQLVKTFSDLGEGEISSDFIGKTTMERLRDVDKVAYVRFASVYCDFKEIKDFSAILDSMDAHD